MMNRNEKLQLIEILDAKGVFDVKGSPEMVARYLGASVFTVYNYMKQIRSSSKADHTV